MNGFRAKLAYWISVFGGAGLSPFAKGTAGSLLSLALWVPILVYTNCYLHLCLVALTFMIGFWASSVSMSDFKSDDPSEIVIDEVAGLGLALLCVPFGLLPIALSFAFFRLFDIWKPWPIRQIERRFKGAFGVMIDDIVAGVLALLFTHLAIRLLPF